MIDQLFAKVHNENLLKPCADLASRIRAEGIPIYMIPCLDAAQMLLLNVSRQTCVAAQTVGGDVAIVLSAKAIQECADMTGLSYGQALEAILLHENGHLFMLKHGGQADSETQAWDYAAARSSLTKDQMDRLRSFCQHGINPASRPEPVVDVCPQWIRRFDALAAHLGYADAWQATGCYRSRLSVDELFSDLNRAGWGFDVSWAIARDRDVSGGLQQLAIDRLDKTELLRNAIPPEQLMPDGSLPRGASLRF